MLLYFAAAVAVILWKQCVMPGDLYTCWYSSRHNIFSSNDISGLLMMSKANQQAALLHHAPALTLDPKVCKCAIACFLPF